MSYLLIKPCALGLHFGLCLSLGLLPIVAHAQYPGQTKEQTAVAVNVPIKAYSFNLSDVRVLPSPFKDNMDREGQWLLSLPVARLLHSFRVNAGLLTDQKTSPSPIN